MAHTVVTDKTFIITIINFAILIIIIAFIVIKIVRTLKHFKKQSKK
ncbi:MAG: hypothetical protein ACRCWG_02285 [Sarcina sp.]